MTDLSRFQAKSGRLFRHGKAIEVETIISAKEPKSGRRRHAALIGCPLSWLKRVLPLLESKEQVVVAIWLHRRQAICSSDLFNVPNKELKEELGISRFIKYRTLDHLEKAGALAVVRKGKKILVRHLW
jgi:hypothetical protein